MPIFFKEFDQIYEKSFLKLYLVQTSIEKLLLWMVLMLIFFKS